MRIPKLLANRFTLAIFTACAAAVTFYVYVVDASSRALIDFDVYTQAAKAFSNGENIYARAYAVTDRWGRSIQLYYYYPPLLAHLFSLFTGFSDASLKFGWCLLNFSLMSVTAISLSAIVKDSWWGSISTIPRALIIGFFVVCFEPLYVGNGDGQVTALVLATLSLATLAACRRKDLLEGSLLGFAISIKISPALLLLAPILFGRWRVVVACVATCAALASCTLLLSGHGAQPFIDFARSLTATVDDALVQSHVFNFVMTKTLLSPLGLSEVTSARWAIKLILLGLAAGGTIAIKKQKGMNYLRAYGFLITCMIITSPIIWFHHFAWMLIPLAVLSTRPAATSDERMKHLTVSLGLYFALSQTYLLNIWARKLVPAIAPVSTLVPAFLLIVIGVAIYRQREP